MESINLNFIKKSKFQKKVSEGIAQCLTCERKCKISTGKTGFCQTKMNIDGGIHTLVYGCIPALSNNPIEKKPLFHFFPGTYAITVGTYGCNFSCPWCQNHHISHPTRPVLDKIKNEKNIRVVIIKGNGPAFCVGHNINELTGKDYDIHHARSNSRSRRYNLFFQRMA